MKTLRRFCVVALVSGCSAIPVIRFSADAGDDAALDAAADSSTNEAGDTGPIEGGIEGGCPNTTPADAVACCGAIPCGNAYCTMAACVECQLKCGANTLCCPKMGGMMVSCVIPPAVCP